VSASVMLVFVVCMVSLEKADFQIFTDSLLSGFLVPERVLTKFD
jgi:hypothetical protein